MHSGALLMSAMTPHTGHCAKYKHVELRVKQRAYMINITKHPKHISRIVRNLNEGNRTRRKPQFLVFPMYQKPFVHCHVFVVLCLVNRNLRRNIYGNNNVK